MAETQFDFIKKINNYLPEDLKGTHKKNPSPDDLLKEDDDDVESKSEKKEKNHKTTAKSLFLSQQ